MISRRTFLLGLGAAATALAGDALAIEPRRVVVTRHRLDSDDVRPDDPVLRVIQVSDLHLQRVTGHSHRIAEAINALRADVVVFTGDMIDKPDRIPDLRSFLSLLGRGSLKYATLGNWEHWARVNIDELRAAYALHACKLLINETVSIRHGGRNALITGVDDWTGGRPDLATALKNVVPHRNHILLAHSPIYRDILGPEAAAHRFSCVLSGHTHGGQVALFGWAPVRPAGSGRYVSGWYRDALPPLYVSRGLGTSLAPIRFGSSPELAVFEWRLS